MTRVTWFGHAAFLFDGSAAVAIDPYGRVDLSDRGWHFGYPPIEGLQADVVLVTHEHSDHNAVEVVGGAPLVIRSTAGTFESPAGQIVAVAGEHDDRAGTARGPNTIFRFTLDGLRICHFGDFGQATLRPEQQQAIGELDVLILPVGGTPTLDGRGAAAIARLLAPRLVIPMHYRTPAIDFLDTVDAFLAELGGDWIDVGAREAEIESLLRGPSETVVAVLGS